MVKFVYLMPVFLFLVALAMAVPMIPHSFWGYAFVDNVLAKETSLIEAYDQDGVKCGSQNVLEDGLFPYLSCKGDDLTSDIDEGAVEGEDIRIYINGLLTNERLIWHSGSNQQLDLHVDTSVVEEKSSNLTWAGPFAMFSLVLVAMVVKLWQVRKHE